MSKPGSEYEGLVQRVFSEIVNQRAVETIAVEKNKTLHGKTTDHEIDVYWRFRHGGIDYETVIQAKDWRTTVPQGEILKLKGILDDLPNQPRGVFVTRTGYQAGSVAVAEANGIVLYELREPADADWKGRLQRISITMHIFVPGMTLKGVNFDEPWIKEQMRQKGVPNLKFSATGPGTSIWLYSESGEMIKNMDQVAQEALSQLSIAETPATDVLVDLNDKALFLKTGNDQVPLAKVKSANITISIGKIEQGIEIDTTELVSVVLNNVLTKEQLFFDKHLRLPEPPPAGAS